MCARCLLVLVAAGVWHWGRADAARAQTVYRWTDERGIVHFSHGPPPGGEFFEVRKMPRSRPRETPALSSAPAESEAAPAAPSSPRLGGEARVELVKSSARTVGPSTRLFEGTVRNGGGTEARNVVLLLTVTETQQGDECLRAEIDVTPSALPPGATGRFAAEFDNPCFFGDISVHLEPEWD